MAFDFDDIPKFFEVWKQVFVTNYIGSIRKVAPVIYRVAKDFGQELGIKYVWRERHNRDFYIDLGNAGGVSWLTYVSEFSKGRENVDEWVGKISLMFHRRSFSFQTRGQQNHVLTARPHMAGALPVIYFDVRLAQTFISLSHFTRTDMKDRTLAAAFGKDNEFELKELWFPPQSNTLEYAIGSAFKEQGFQFAEEMFFEEGLKYMDMREAFARSNERNAKAMETRMAKAIRQIIQRYKVA